MTIGPSSPARVSFNCDGATKVFPVPIQAYQPTDLSVILTAPASAGGAQSTLMLNSDYSLSTSGTLQPTAWTLTTLSAAAYASGFTLQIFVNPVQQQQTQYVQGQAFPSLAVQTNADRLTQMAQRLQDQINRTVRVPDGDVLAVNPLPSASNRLGLSIVCDPITGVPGVGQPTTSVVTVGSITNLLGLSQTAIETAVGATVINPAYPPGSVDRYATNTVPGTTSMVGAFNAAIAQCMAGGSKVTYGRTSTYLLDSPVNATVSAQPNKSGLTIENTGGAGADSPVFNILAKHSGQSVFDFTGNDSVVLRDVNITTDAVTYPVTGILTARNASNGSLLFRAENCKVQGHFSVACFYNYGSEDDVLSGCYFRNDATTAGTKTRVYTGSNISGITSPFTAIASGQVSCIDHNDFGCLDFNQAGTTTADCIYLEASDSFKKVGGWAYNASATTDGRALIYVDTNGGTTTCNFCSIKGMTSEQATALQRYFLLFGTGAVTHVGWSIDATKMPNGVAAIACIDSTVILDNFSLIAGTVPAGGGISIPGTLQNSPSFNYGNEILSVVIGTSNKNCLIGETANLTVTTRTHDYWIDTGIGNKSFAPGIATGVNGWTAVGAITQSASYLLSGGIAYFEISVSGATSIACTSGATITTLPFATVNVGEASVYDPTARSLIGVGTVNSKTITMPAVTTNTNGIIIKGWYFVA